MKRKLLMALLAGTLAIAAPVSCFAAETTEVAEADAAEDSSDEEEDADAEEADAESADSDDAKEETNHTPDAAKKASDEVITTPKLDDFTGDDTIHSVDPEEEEKDSPFTFIEP